MDLDLEWEGAPTAIDVTLVDDVITKGRTLLAAASLFQAALPWARVRAFAAIRTMGRVEEVERVLDPCRGVLTLVDGDVRRDP